MTTDAEVDTVYLLGTGAAVGAWEPVVRAVARAQQIELPQDARLARDVVNWVFNFYGRLVHLTSSWRSLRDEQYEARFGSGRHAKVRAAVSAVDEDYRRSLNALKDGIAAALQEAHDRRDIEANALLLGRLAEDAGKGSTVIMTANWDLALEEHLIALGASPEKVLHLHGDIRNPRGMLLPGERPEELYRDEQGNASITSAYFKAINVIRVARRVYIAGLSLSPLDAALGLALGMGLAENRRNGEIIIANSSQQEIERIEQQLRSVTPAGWSFRGLPIA